MLDRCIVIKAIKVMKTKDLRIGNFVEIEGVISEVMAINCENTVIEVRAAEAGGISVQMADVRPIPLSGQMLTEFCSFDNEGRHIIGIDQHRHYLKIQDGYIVLLNKAEEPLIHFYDVRYLHSLQNLYYMLKGEEMKVSFQ